MATFARILLIGSVITVIIEIMVLRLARTFYLGAIAQGMWDGSLPVWSRGKVSVEALGLKDEVPQKLKQFANIVYKF